MKERIQEYMIHKNINAGELAHSLDVQRSNISHILNGRNKPSAAFIEKMLTVYPDLNARWLLTGEGNMTDSYTPISKIPDVAKSQVNETPEAEESKEVIKEVIKATIAPESSSTNTPKIHFRDDKLDRIVMFYKDGTFTSFTSRSEK